MEEKEILIRLKSGDHEAFSWLYDRYWNQIYNFCRLYTHSVEDSKEVVQRVFVKVWEAHELVKENDNFKGFLFIITRNIIFNLSKKKFNEEFYKLSVFNAFDSSDVQIQYEIEDDIVVTQLGEYVSHLIEALPPRQKEVFLLSRKNNLSYKEISIRLEISERIVERHMMKALKSLRQSLKLFSIFLTC